jgi:gliding motility-associated-like protein
VWIPNAFSPNGDAHNDLFKVYAGCQLVGYTLKIYTRWGEIIYQSNDPSGTWDGNYKNTIVPQGMYMYTVEFWKELPGRRDYKYMKGMVMLLE